MKNKGHLDEIDKEIISILMIDAKTPYAEIAKKLIVSPGTIHVRIKKLEEQGIIKNSVLQVDHSKLGYDLVAFLGIYLDQSSSYSVVIEDLKKVPEVLEAYYTTGIYSVFVKIVCKNTNDMRDVLGEKIQSIKGISRTETLIALEESIKRQIKLE